VVGSDASFLSVSSKHQRTVFASVRFPLQHHEQKMQVLRRNLLTGAALYRTDVVRKLGTWDEDRRLAGAEDYDFLVRAVHSGQLLGFVDRPLYVIRVHPGQQSANRVRSLRARVAALQKFEDGGPEVRFLREAQRSIREADRRINAYRSSSVLRSTELGLRRHVALWWALSMPQFRRRRLGLLAAALGPPTFSGRALARIIGPDAA
jgi:GT2 family glycosyltransferase